MNIERESFSRFKTESELREAKFKQKESEESLLAQERRERALTEKTPKSVLEEELKRKEEARAELDEGIRALKEKLEREDGGGHA